MRINEQIRAKEVRLTSEDGEQLGVVSLQEALRQAEEEGLDLVEIAPQAKPPVCKIIDYGKFLYQKEKKAKEAKKNQVKTEIKEIKFGPKIGDNDFNYRVKHIIEFLEKGDKIKVTIRFRGRELAHTELGFRITDRVVEMTKEVATVEKKAKLEGRNITMFLSPLKGSKKK